jgi:nucleoside-diphosphate-sugar epimerase
MAVRGVNRRGDAPLPAEVERMAADITTAAGAGAAVSGASVVYMAAQPAYHRWSQEFPAMLESVIDACGREGTRLVMVDNLYTYGPGAGPMGEDTPERATDKKGVVRRRMTEMLRAADGAGRVPVAIGRASDYFGPRADNSGITAIAIAKAAAGKKPSWMLELDVPHSVAFLPDVAMAFVSLGTSDKAFGETWVLPHGPAPTGREFLELVNREMTSPGGSGLITKGMLLMAAPFVRTVRETLDLSYQWQEPFVADDSKFQRVFGPFEVTPLAEAVRLTMEAYRARQG